VGPLRGRTAHALIPHGHPCRHWRLDLRTLARAAPKKKRDVFLFVISGAKEKNPAAAQGIIAGLPK
jgi:hypothetical protein